MQADNNLKMYSYSINPNIAVIQSKTDTIPAFPLGENLDESPASAPFKMDITFDVLKDFSYRVKDFHKFQYYWGLAGKDEVYYQRPIGIGITLKLYLKNLLDHPTLVVNNAYLKYVRFKVDSVYPPGVHLADILTVNLLHRGYCPVHCAAISSPDDGGILLFAPPDTGKTLTTFGALKQGFHYLAEDIAFVDTEFVYANPHTVTFLHNKQFSAQAGANNPFSFITEKIPLVSSYTKTPKVSMSNLMKNFKVDEKAPIRKIFLLDRGPRSIERIPPDVMGRRILIINRNEFWYHKNALLFAYAYFNSNLDLHKLMEVEKEIINQIISKADCYLIQTKDPLEYLDLIKQALKK